MAPSMTPSDQPKKRSWTRIALIVTGGLIGLCVVCAIIGSLVDPPAPQTAVNPFDTTVDTRAASGIATAESRPLPTATDAPTPEPRPTREPRPTPEPTQEPTPAPPTATPEPPTATPPPAPVVLEGTGQIVTDPFTPPALASRMVIKHTGQSNFVVTVFAGDEEDLSVNEIGNYSGIRPLFTSGEEVYLEVDADGPWSITVEAIPRDDAAAAGIDGAGAFVSGAFAPVREGAVPYTFTHDGESNFAIYVHCAGGSDLVQNEIGAVDNQAVVRFAEGPCLWEVEADGAWTVRPR